MPENFSLEAALREAIDSHLVDQSAPISSDLVASIRYSILSPGKRIRPRLVLASGQMLGISAATILPIALAVEMIHCFTLIHDDLPCMDNDDFRRGMPSNHKKFGESTALLAGDALITLAVDTFLNTEFDPQRLIAGLRRLMTAIGPHGVIGGQAAESFLNSDSRLSDLEWVHQQKTGALFSAALLIPKDLAGISDDAEPGLSLIRFADELGMAFQVADDLEDELDFQPGLKPQPTSILFYLPPEVAREKTIRKLTLASQKLRDHWTDQSAQLQSIADEVILKIQKTVKKPPGL